MMTACLAEGHTTLENCAREPEIVDLANFLNKMGAKVCGAAKDTINIVGVKSMTSCFHTVIPDRVEAGTYLIAAAATGGSIKIKNVNPGHLDAVLGNLREAGAGQNWDYLRNAFQILATIRRKQTLKDTNRLRLI